MILFFLTAVAAIDMIEQEILQSQELITALKEKLEYLGRYREELVSMSIQIPQDDEWKTIPGLIPQPDHDSLPNRLISLASIPTSSKGVDFIALKNNKDNTPRIGLIICQASLVNLYTISGDLLSTYAVNSIQFCAGSSTADDPLIAVASSTELLILSFDGKNLQLANSKKLFNDTAAPTTLINYSRLGKKYWLVGDNWGRVTFFSGTGEVIGQGPTGTKSVTVLDKYGSQIVFAGENKVGIYNLATMDVYQECEPALDDVLDVAQDYSATIIYVLCKNGDIVIYDTKHSSASSAPMCKSVARFDNHFYHPTKLAPIRGSLLAISNDVVISYNFSHLEQDTFYPPTFYKLKTNESPVFRTLRMPNAGNYMVVVKSGEILTFEVVHGSVGGSGGGGTDYANVALLVLMFFGGILLWKVMQGSKKTGNEPQYKREKSLGKGKVGEKNVRFSDKEEVFRYRDN